MSEQESTQQASENNSRAEMMSALFAQLILQQTNMAMMLLGKVAHPESGQTYTDFEAARLFIDQLEMIELKTKGNLTKEESGLLKQSLMNLRLAFVEAVDSPERKDQPAAKPKSGGPGSGSTPAQTESTTETPPTITEDEHRKKFSKKY